MLDVTVYADYLGHWCWPAALNLRKLKREIPKVRLVHRSYLLRPGVESRRYTELDLRHRVTAADATGLPFRIPRSGQPYPSTSLTALEAARWVETHHPDRFDDFDLAVYAAFFQEALDISSPALLAKLASQLRLDGAGLAMALSRGIHRAQVLREHQEAAHLGITVLPAVFVGDTQLCGAAPYADYVDVVREELATRRPARRVASGAR
jgi:predicted DsbA family dithiol-disulfide isomerase